MGVKEGEGGGGRLGAKREGECFLGGGRRKKRHVVPVKFRLAHLVFSGQG